MLANNVFLCYSNKVSNQMRHKRLLQPIQSQNFGLKNFKILEKSLKKPLTKV